MKRIEKHSEREVIFEDSQKWPMPGEFIFITEVFESPSKEVAICEYLNRGWQIYENGSVMRETTSTITFYRPLKDSQGRAIEWEPKQNND